jgi:hypothetical protein
MMGTLRNNQKGFGTVEIILIIVIVAVIGVVGWFVYKNHNKTTTNSSTATTTTQATKSTTPTTTQPASETDKWYLYTSSGGEYKVRLADGLTFIGSSDSPSIYTLEPIALGSTSAKVVIQNSGGESDHGLYINYFGKSADASVAGDKQTGFKTQAGLDVEKYYYFQATEPQGLGLSKGGKEYTYRIIKDGKALTITYDISPSGTANTDLVEKMVKTVQL